MLEGSGRVRQNHQASVSLRILPRVLGAVCRAQAEAQRAATVSLRAVTDNPVYRPPDAERPLGAVDSNGGYHNAQAAPVIDGVAFAHTDLCQLAQRLTDHLFQDPATAPLVGGDEWTVKPLHMVQNGWAEEARAIAAPTTLSLGRFGQNDVPALNFLAWRKATAIGRCLDFTGTRGARRDRLAGSLRRRARAAAAASPAAGSDPQRLPAGEPPASPRRRCERLTETFTAEVFG